MLLRYAPLTWHLARATRCTVVTLPTLIAARADCIWYELDDVKDGVREILLPDKHVVERPQEGQSIAYKAA